MKSSGYYALLQANGMPFAELVKAIRDEQAGYLRTFSGRILAIQDMESADRVEDSVEWRVWTDDKEATGE